MSEPSRSEPPAGPPGGSRRPDLARYAGRAQRRRVWFRHLAKLTRLDLWFPHVPLALGFGIAGLILLASIGGSGLSLHALESIPARTLTAHKVAIPSAMIGIAMITMSLGLLLRSRFSWGVAIVLTASTLVVALYFRHSIFSVLAWFDAVLLLALVLSQRSFTQSSLAAGSLFALTSAGLLLMYAVFGALYLGHEFSQPVDSLATALYYAVITMSTVGYGDITPVTAHARLFTVSITVLGITVFATSLSAVVVPVVSGSLKRMMNQKGNRMKRKDHYVIAGNTPLAANTYRELRSRNQPVTLIFAQAPVGGEYEEADLVIGDPTDIDVLRHAGAEAAHAVLAMRADDSENAFIVLAVKELGGKAKTVAAVNDGKHVARIKRVHPDILIAPQVLGGELLAMALSGEDITGDFVMDRFLHFDS